MIADPFVQLRLLDVQAVDTALAQIAHRRRTLPELAAIAELDDRAAALHGLLVESETKLADLDAEQRRLEADVDAVRQRAQRDQQRMEAAATPAKEVAGLQHEVASLARRQGVLEDELLELMEQRELVEAEVARHRSEVERIVAERATAESSRDEVFAELDDAEAKRTVERGELVANLPDDLLGLYEKVRESSGGVGAAALHQRRCEGCRIELAGSELSAVRAAKPETVIRCENCRRILVRTADSGL